MKRILLPVSAALFLLASCKKDATPEYDVTVKAPLSVEFDNIVGGADLQLNTATYTNALSQNFTVTKLKYFVSNFKLTNVNGTVYTVPQTECYFLVDESVTTSHKPLLSVPEGEYTAVSFVLGVDSLRNTMDISQRTGVLDVSGAAIDMYWSWNSGYIFFKLEGTSPAVASTGNAFSYHIGGFGGYTTATVNNNKTITVDLKSRGTAKVKNGKNTNIHLLVDILKAFNGSTNITLGSPASVHSAAAGTPMANNYANMVSHDHTEN